MTPQALEIFRQIEPRGKLFMSSARHVVLTEEVFAFTAQIALDENDPANIRPVVLPSLRCVVQMRDMLEGVEQRGDEIIFYPLSMGKGRLYLNPFKFGWVFSTKDRSFLRKEPNGEGDFYSGLFSRAAFVAFDLMAMPRVIRETPPSPKRVERARKKLGRYYPLAWSNVSWEIGGEAAAKLVLNPHPEHGVARHEVRGHYRLTHQGAPKAEFMHQPSHGWNYYSFVKAHKRGDEAFGVKLGRLTPTLKMDAPSGERAVQSLRLNALVATSDATRN